MSVKVKIHVRVVDSPKRAASVLAPRLSSIIIPSPAAGVRHLMLLRLWWGQAAVLVLVGVAGLVLVAGWLAGSDQTEQALAQDIPGQLSQAQETRTALDIPIRQVSTEPASPEMLHMTFSQLEVYLDEISGGPARRAQLAIEEARIKRTQQIHEYLEAKHSPLAEFSDLLAGLQHWRLVLAISNSESSLGKRCADNNCSGIGVEPGHRLWRSYDNKGDWAKDLDRLLERRYKDWTLPRMNGVYNQPGSDNWVRAATQVLLDIQSID